MRHYKLSVHQKTFESADLLINPKDFPSLELGDIVEIYHQEDEFSRLLLQVTKFKENLQGRDTISVEENAAAAFQLRKYRDVFVNKVNPCDVALDSVEVTFKDQYIGRSEMWRLKNSLVNTCVYVNKKIEFCGDTARLQIYEMWVQGERVACGVITEETKIIYRSSTSMVYLFIQMSSEMWEFDIHGDLYFEKAVNGFVADLFEKWKKNGSNHEVTVVLFSRAFYKAHTWAEFPEYMRECLQQDYKGRFHEDFYRVAVQNEKYDDWSGTLVLLRNLFVNYRETVLEYHNKPKYKVPQAYLSSAAQGNFLEVLNISLNVFEKHYLERSLDRTGQLSVVISPGVGVFEVDRELTNVTKQRIIDNGVGSDLVCVGEQPLHAVPLFKFNNKDNAIMRDDYSMPHWINLSFYSIDKKLAYCKFVPRIRLPSSRPRTNQHVMAPKPRLPTDALDESVDGGVSAGDIDYDAYDAQIFANPQTSSIQSVVVSRTKKISLNQDSKTVKWKMSDPDIYPSQATAVSNPPTVLTRSTSITLSDSKSSSIALLSSSYGTTIDYEKPRSIEFFLDEEFSPTSTGLSNSGCSSASSAPYNAQQSISYPQSTGYAKSLINPFDPSHLTIKMTSNRRRWTHVFPKGPNGVVIQRHHYLSSPDENIDPNKKVFDHETNNGFCDEGIYARSPPSHEYRYRSRLLVGSPGSSASGNIKKTQTLLWGVTGEQEWTPLLTTGVDWKSLTIPACLPITTDYFPDEVCLKTDYVFSDYNLLPDDVNADYAQKRAIYRNPLKTSQVFKEIISQRLAQGFQIITEPDSGLMSPTNTSKVGAGRSSVVVSEYKLSIGRIFHRISLFGSEIRVTRYIPKYPYPPFDIQYRYRFQAPDHATYEVSWIQFNAEKLENFKWNYLDHYICTRGDKDYALLESCKYWRFRMYVLPSHQPGTKKILDGSDVCDVYTRLSSDEQKNLLEGFLKFVETLLNKIKRKPVPKQQKDILSSQLTRRRHSTGIVYLTNSQEKHVASNRIEKSGNRSGSKVLEKLRISPATDVIMPLTVTVDSDVSEIQNNGNPHLNSSVSNSEIIDLFCHPVNGVGFLSKYPSLPSNTFISYDGVQWLMENVEGIDNEKDAIRRLEKMRIEELICHASGDSAHPFIYGFYLYYVTRRENSTSDFVEPIHDLVTFENEWAEIEALPLPPPQSSIPHFLQDIPPESSHTASDHGFYYVPLYKQTHLEIDVNNKSDRVEWGHARYHSVYNVEEAFEFVIDWVAASGPIVSDLIYSFSRKAQAFNLQLVPVPADPHALPYELKSDPLRGPIFIPLDIECLMGNKSYLFEEFPEDTWHVRLLLLQEEIAIRFGFLMCRGRFDSTHHHRQYVHLTGNIFLLVASPCNEVVVAQESPPHFHSKAYSMSPRNRLITESNDLAVSPHQEYISRHVTDSSNKQHFKPDNRVPSFCCSSHTNEVDCDSDSDCWQNSIDVVERVASQHISLKHNIILRKGEIRNGNSVNCAKELLSRWIIGDWSIMPKSVGNPVANNKNELENEDHKLKTPRKKRKKTVSVESEMSNENLIAKDDELSKNKKKKIKTKEEDDEYSSEEERWLDAIESGKLEEVDDELKKIKSKDPKLMTARQRAMLDKKCEKDGTTDHLLSLPSGYREKIETPEMLEQKAEKQQKRKQMADAKKERDRNKTMERLLKKSDSKSMKTSQKQKPFKQEIPRIVYSNTIDLISVSLPADYGFPLKATAGKSVTPPVTLCSVDGCKEVKKYSCSKTGVPLCSLQCYKTNLNRRMSVT